MLPINQTTPAEQAKLEKVAKGICPSCGDNITKLETIAVCNKCPFEIPYGMFEGIQKQYGKKDGN